MTVIIPARNEESDIAGCIAAIAAQTIDSSQIEVLLVDGESDDGTSSVARRAADESGLDLKVIVNPDRTAATSLNRGLGAARGAIVVRVDARARIQAHHVAECRRLLDEDPARAVVGGGQRPILRPDAGLVERGIVRSLRNRYTTGLARYRRGAGAGPTDTVWMGAFRVQALRDVGGWPTYPEQNQDFRLNEALRGSGGIVWFDPRLDAGYLPRRDLVGLGRQYLRFGRAKGQVWAAGERPRPRQVLLLAVPVVAAGAFAVLLAKVGPVRAVALVVTGGFVIDQVGCDEPAGPAERGLSVGATAIADGAWFVGVVDGLAARWRR